ncbi:uncharacterized protein LOC128276149, partial [Anopheles cruzii]|uniref:uncharacterized protein LOC128276149 n=1 Tax=Anopheles cruzii TaxID=68878 RepID=UPI0022EC7CAA
MGKFWSEIERRLSHLPNPEVNTASSPAPASTRSAVASKPTNTRKSGILTRNRALLTVSPPTTSSTSSTSTTSSTMIHQSPNPQPGASSLPAGSTRGKKATVNSAPRPSRLATETITTGHTLSQAAPAGTPQGTIATRTLTTVHTSLQSPVVPPLDEPATTTSMNVSRSGTQKNKQTAALHADNTLDALNGSLQFVNSTKSKGGGVLIACSSKLRAAQIAVTQHALEIVWVTISPPTGSRIFLGAIYIPPDLSSDEDTLESLSECSSLTWTPAPTTSAVPSSHLIPVSRVQPNTNSAFLSMLLQSQLQQHNGVANHMGRIGSGSLPSAMYLNDTIADNSADICSLFAIHFAGLFAEPLSSAASLEPGLSYTPEGVVNVAELPIDVDLVEKALSDLRLSFAPDPDGIPASVFK